MPGLAAALWLLGLFAAASLLRARGTPYEFADRLRDALILGVLVPLTLAAVQLLYPATLWLALGALVAAQLVRAGARPRARAPHDAAAIPYLTIAALAVVAWPPLMRPPLDGDTLSYHLPNAASWVHAHGFWTTDARYWWYPPGSETFAAALYAVAGPFAVGWSGLAALLLLGTRIASWTREAFAVPALASDALAAATVTALPLALQAGTLQNDVWLAAFFLEALRWPRAPVLAIAALIKPYGWIFAALAAAVARAPLRAWLAMLAAIAAWALHDALLWHQSLVAPAETSTANTWSSTVLAHGWSGLTLFVTVLGKTSPFALIAYAAAFAAPLFTRGKLRALGWAAFGAAAAFLAMPLAFADWHPQLASGESLRFAAPAIAAGAIVLARPVARFAAVATPLLLASAAYGAAAVLAIFWNDATARAAIGVALVAVAAAWLSRRFETPWPVVAGITAATIATTALAAHRPVGYYADALSIAGRPAELYAWIARDRPAAVGGWGLRIGAVNALSPGSRAIDLPDEGACSAARARGVVLIATAEADRSAAFNARRLRAARACGRLVFASPDAIVADPR
ncbi:MAG TPA: hypothetical protein VMF61_00450 [Candidatus Acidoferrales bacterium]|nr:hypothetical protein [Candidatus Acidoferrales bacterium]